MNLVGLLDFVLYAIGQWDLANRVTAYTMPINAAVQSVVIVFPFLKEWIITDIVGLKYGEKGFNYDWNINVCKSVFSFGLFLWAIFAFIGSLFPPFFFYNLLAPLVLGGGRD